MRKLLILLFIPLIGLASSYMSLQQQASVLNTLDKNILVEIEKLAKTPGNNDVWVVTLGKKSKQAKPALLIMGNITGHDLTSTELCFDFFKTIIENATTVDSVKSLLEKNLIYIIPNANPDASDQYFNKVKYERFVNGTKTDTDKDGLIDEDGCEDLNGDGYITQMIVEDPLGEYVFDSDSLKLLRKADKNKNEIGKYLLFTEGFDNDKDGLINEDKTGGVCLNENFTYNYKFFSPDAGEHQLCEPESKAIADFCFSHPNIAAVYTFSENSNLMKPWDVYKKIPENLVKEKAPFTKVLPKDKTAFKTISNSFIKQTQLADAPKSVKGNGAFSEWAYYHYGRWSFAENSWWIPTIKDTTKKKDKKTTPDSLKTEKNAYTWLSQNSVDFFVNWDKVNHPDFAHQTVMVGGFVPFARTLAPVDSLSSMSNKINPFLTKLVQFLPSLKIEKTNVKKLSDTVYRVDVFVRNNGLLPTTTEIGEKMNWGTKTKLSVQLTNKQKLQSGTRYKLYNRIDGNGGTIKHSWVIISPADSTIKITVDSPTAGYDEKDVKLN